MKILTAEQIRSADAFTIGHEPISSIDLMERASKACFEKINDLFPEVQVFHVFCGIGNNGGDGLVLARLLHSAGKKVDVNIIRFAEQNTQDFAVNLERLRKLSVQITEIKKADELTELNTGVIIDAMLGTGVNRPLEGLLKDVAAFINRSSLDIIAIDLPSGIYERGNDSGNLSACVKADYTLSFQVPKLCFLLTEIAPWIGQWYVLDIGLSEAFIQKLETRMYTFTQSDALKVLKQRGDHSHKGTFGHACLAVGSKGKIGAAILASESCLRSGVGLLTCYLPKCAYEIMQERLPEAMALTSDDEDSLTAGVDLSIFGAIGAGPGISVNPKTTAFITELFSTVSKPLVLDADALNILSENPELLSEIPANSILTPHPKEFERLFGKTSDSEERLELLLQKAVELKLILVLKGHYTAVTLPSGVIWFNTSGNAGMATGGSGDVLTGILTSLLAQDYLPEEAASLGVYLHGLAGDLASNDLGQEAMIASDITQHLGNAFKLLHTLQEK